MIDYTKGEWVVGITYDEYGWPTYRLRDMDAGNKAEVEANAHLIKAAPHMYEALKMAQEGTGDWRGMIDYALAEAEGKE